MLNFVQPIFFAIDDLWSNVTCLSYYHYMHNYLFNKLTSTSYRLTSTIERTLFIYSAQRKGPTVGILK